MTEQGPDDLQVQGGLRIVLRGGPGHGLVTTDEERPGSILYSGPLDPLGAGLQSVDDADHFSGLDADEQALARRTAGGKPAEDQDEGESEPIVYATYEDTGQSDTEGRRLYEYVEGSMEFS